MTTYDDNGCGFDFSGRTFVRKTLYKSSGLQQGFAFAKISARFSTPTTCSKVINWFDDKNLNLAMSGNKFFSDGHVVFVAASIKDLESV